MMLTKGQNVRLTIDELHPDGYGAGTYLNSRILVEYGVTGDDITVEIYKIKDKNIYASIKETHSASLHRAKAACEHFSICSGCSWQHINKELQIKMRRKKITMLFDQAGIVLRDDMIENAFPQDYQYRRKARFSVRYDKKKNQMYVGFRETNPRFIANIKNCAVLVNPKWPQLWKNILQQLECKNSIPQLEYLSGDNEECFIIRLLEKPSLADLSTLHLFKNEYNIRIFIQAHKKLNVVELKNSIEETYQEVTLQHNGELCKKEPHINYKCGSLTFQAGAFDFIQVNKKVTDWMLKNAITWLKPLASDSLLDLFCGLGPFALTFAPHVQQVHGIELEKNMVDKAKNHAERYFINNASFEQRDLFDKPNSTIAPYDILIIDPPRSGMPHLDEWVQKCNPRDILYVSCHATTLVRDIQPLLTSGRYTLKHIAIMDMFAQTKHEETMVMLTRADHRNESPNIS